MASIRVLQVSKSTGGVGQYLRSLVYGLNKERFELVVVCLSDGSEILAEEFSHVNGVRAVSLPMDRYRINPLTDIWVWWWLGKLIRREKIDVIHAHASKPGFLTRFAAIGSGIPTIYSPACFSFHAGVPKWKARLYAAAERFAAAFFTSKIMTVCKEEQNLAQDFCVGKDTLFVNVYNGVEPDIFEMETDRNKIRNSISVPYDAFLIGTVARLSKQKAPHDFVMAAARVHENHPGTHFVWVGGGELEKEIKTLVQSLGLEGVFHLIGQRNDIPELLQAFDCFVLSSHWEGFSLSVLEAMASGLPVIMTRVTGAAEAVVDGVTGLLVPIGDTKAMADGMVQFISNPARAKEFGKAGRIRLKKNFTLDRMIMEIEEIYQTIVATSHSH